MGAVLSPLVTEDVLDEPAWSLLRALRQPGREPGEVRSLVRGLLHATATGHLPLGANLVWTVLDLTMEDLEAFRQAIDAPEDGSEMAPEDMDLNVDELRRCLDEQPVIERMLSRAAALAALGLAAAARHVRAAKDYDPADEPAEESFFL